MNMKMARSFIYTLYYRRHHRCLTALVLSSTGVSKLRRKVRQVSRGYCISFPQETGLCVSALVSHHGNIGGVVKVVRRYSTIGFHESAGMMLKPSNLKMSQQITASSSWLCRAWLTASPGAPTFNVAADHRNARL